MVKDRLGEESENIQHREDHEIAGRALKSTFFDGERFVPMRLVNFFLQALPEYTFITPVNDQGGDVVWKYNHDSGIYERTGIPWIEQQVQTVLEDDVSTRRQNEVIKQLKVATYTEPWEFLEIPEIIVLENGSLNVLTQDFGTHSPHYKAKTRLPVKYDPNATCPEILNFLEEVTPKNIDFIQEWIGYHLIKDYRYQRCVVLVGDGDNGKSTFLNIIRNFLGNENVCSESLYKLTVNRFAAAELQGRLANIAADIGPDELKQTGVIKMLTGGDWITVERKNRDPFEFKNYAKLTFSCNQLPRTPDETLAFFKRFLVLIFDKTIPKEDQDPQLLDKLTTPEELSGLLNWAIEGLTRLLQQGSFAEPGAAADRKQLYLAMSDPVTGFIKECVLEEPDEYVEKDELLRAFEGYCKSKGFITVSDNRFFKQFKRQIWSKETQIRIGQRRPRVLKGIKLSKNVTNVTDVTGSTNSPENQQKLGGVYRTRDTRDNRDSNPNVKNLIAKAEAVLKLNKCLMTQKAFYDHLEKNGHHREDAEYVLRGYPQFAFMGLNVKLVEASQ